MIKISQLVLAKMVDLLMMSFSHSLMSTSRTSSSRMTHIKQTTQHILRSIGMV